MPLRNEIGVWTNAAELTTIIGEEVQAAMLGQKTADAAVDAMQKRLEVDGEPEEGRLSSRPVRAPSASRAEPKRKPGSSSPLRRAEIRVKPG